MLYGKKPFGDQLSQESILEQQTGVLHAGEAESSMLMHLRPELVDERAR